MCLTWLRLGCVTEILGHLQKNSYEAAVYRCVHFGQVIRNIWNAQRESFISISPYLNKIRVGRCSSIRDSSSLSWHLHVLYSMKNVSVHARMVGQCLTLFPAPGGPQTNINRIDTCESSPIHSQHSSGL